MNLGAFSMSLSVNDILTSKEFYEKLGFEACGGNIEDDWLIMQNDDCVIGLFQGMFPKNMLTFNPGWGCDVDEDETFTDVRAIQEELLAKGVEIITPTDPKGTGPAYILLADPDGNPIIIDQHR